ncbi:HlyD family secretion protein [Komagataeibacter medellinensis]|uniref:Major facilitator superfamily multidrug resistance transporter HlyD/EmrA/FusE n=1 Tax=Komagataeibacter medellinensis (strain NBRC 3288 / BCRC 11682 / LMG 1693 / Kondo 51) TaxID=634177 RepID=G2I5N4_KOMMN|nr:HlyD family secretion protein [Komagataeibacter medellinensis]BAK83431.1 major facilitator superfamily multidrug resistance transporter HlyD/EmrA/FusE [Komagataeibacter medellinensis NBRC 3288]
MAADEGKVAEDGHVAPGPGTEAKKEASPRRKLILIGIVVAVIVLGGIYWFLHRNEVETDDAFTTGRAVAVAPHVGGYVTELLVNDNQFVHQGDILARIDDRNWRAQRDQAAAAVAIARAQVNNYTLLAEVAKKNFPGHLMVAQGQLQSAQAQQFRAETDYRRQHGVTREATSQQNIDYATAALNAAKAQVLEAQGNLETALPVIPNIASTEARVTEQQATLNQAEAKLREADLNVEWTLIRAPHDGWISQRNIERGTLVTAGQTVFSIVEPEIWVVANYKETQLTHMRPGQKVDIAIDAYPFLKLKGHVDSLQLGTGATFSAFPPENATGNYVKIVQRVPVKILIDEGLRQDLPLALGLSVEPTVHTE